MAATITEAQMQGGGSAPSDVGGASADLCDGFYQFRARHLASWFGINIRGVTAGDLGITKIYHEDKRREVNVFPEMFVWPCFEALPMGWAWAPWVCHETLVDVMLATS